MGFGSKDIEKARDYSEKYGCRDYGDYDHFLNSDIDAIYTALEQGESFQNLIAAYGTDPGMKDEATLAAGYKVHKDSMMYDSAFTEGAFQEKMQKILSSR